MSELLFILGIILVAAFGILRAYGSVGGALSYLSTKEGKGVLAGIVLFIGIALVFAAPRAFSEEVRYFTHAEVFVGLDYTKKLSPMCEEGRADDKATSNGGFRFNILESDRTIFNLKYTHHSCAFSPDTKSYDALGAEITYRFWGR